jgi:2-polyprenyl-6-methoxyphenol hydroxylase-like FAD-dependent oxidoreductase
MASETEVDVCIVGGGPAGMVLANLLASRGVKTLVLEKSPDFEREFRGEVLQPRFMRAMAQVGLDAFILDQPHERFDQGRFYQHGELIGSFHYDRVDPEHPFVMWMTQPVMLRALHERARHYPSFELWFDARAHELLVHEGAVTGVRVQRDDAEIDVRARLVVAADGRFSTLARLGEFEIEYEHYPFDVLWFNVERPADAVNQISFFLSRDAAYISVPKYPDLFQIGMMMTKGAFRGFRERGIESLRQEIRGAHSWFGDFADTLEDFSAFNVLQGKLNNRTRWARDGLLLIGDAAHTCSPIGAVGVSVAIETAIVAADVILNTPADQPFTAANLDQVQARRAADVRRVHRIQRLAGDNVSSRNPVLGTLRPLALRLASATGILPRLAARLVTRRGPLPISTSFTRE